jgi:hypothetical protein
MLRRAVMIEERTVMVNADKVYLIQRIIDEPAPIGRHWIPARKLVPSTRWQSKSVVSPLGISLRLAV